MRRSALALMLLAPGVAAVAGPAAAQFQLAPGADDSPDKRITICHATSSASNPYRLITVAADSILDPRRGVVGHGSDSGTHSRDIIPAFSFTWQGRDYAYEGKNLDGDGAALLANRCAPLGTDTVDPGEPTWGDDPIDDTPDATPQAGGNDPGDSPGATPFNRTTIQSIDEVAPEGLGDTAQPRTLDEARPNEAVLRVSIRPSSRRPLVGQRVTFRVTGRALGPAEAQGGTLCAAVPSGFSLRDSGGGMVMGRVICWFNGIAATGATARSFVAVPTRRAAGRVAVAPASNSASNAYRAEAATVVRPRLLTRLIAVTG